MALKVIYEGVPAGEEPLKEDNLTTSANNIVAGTVALVDGTTGEIIAGDDSATTGAASPAADVAYGLVADDKEDVVTSGKITVYVTPGKYATDQIEGTPAIGDDLTYHTDLKVKTAGSGDRVIGYVTKAATAENPFLEMVFTNSNHILA